MSDIDATLAGMLHELADAYAVELQRQEDAHFANMPVKIDPTLMIGRPFEIEFPRARAWNPWIDACLMMPPAPLMYPVCVPGSPRVVVDGLELPKRGEG